MSRYFVIYIVVVLCTVSCADSKETEPSPPDLISTVKIDINKLHLDTLNWKPQPTGFEMKPQLIEASGIVASVKMPGKLWTHNDSQNAADVYLYNSNGVIEAIAELEGVYTFDVEDIAIFEGDTDEGSYLVLGDFGDNFEIRPDIRLLFVKEPLIEDGKDVTVEPFKILTLTYPNDSLDQLQAFNCEAFFVDHLTKNIFLFTKAEDISHVFRVKSPYLNKESLTLEHVLSLQVSGQKITAADISQDGESILLRTYEYVLKWERTSNESVIKALQNSPVLLPYVKEPNGEAVCWSADAKNYYTVGEVSTGETQKLYKYEAK